MLLLFSFFFFFFFFFLSRKTNHFNCFSSSIILSLCLRCLYDHLLSSHNFDFRQQTQRNLPSFWISQHCHWLHVHYSFCQSFNTFYIIHIHRNKSSTILHLLRTYTRTSRRFRVFPTTFHYYHLMVNNKTNADSVDFSSTYDICISHCISFHFISSIYFCSNKKKKERIFQMVILTTTTSTTTHCTACISNRKAFCFTSDNGSSSSFSRFSRSYLTIAVFDLRNESLWINRQLIALEQSTIDYKVSCLLKKTKHTYL